MMSKRFTFNRRFISILLLAVGFLMSYPSLANHPAFSSKMLAALKAQQTPNVQLQTLSLRHAKIYYAVIPAGFDIRPVLSPRLSTLAAFNAPTVAILAVNAGYFDPKNAKTASYVTIDGKELADPTQNENLTGNTRLQPYLPKIFNRSEFRVYDCNQKSQLDITPHDAPIPTGCTLKHSLGGGPQLVTDKDKLKENLLTEGFIDYDPQGRKIRDPLGVFNPDARSAMGITDKGAVIILMAAQLPKQPRTGVNFNQLATLLKSLGAVKALALDGGSSCGLTVGDQTFYGKFNKDGLPIKRTLKSVLIASPPAS